MDSTTIPQIAVAESDEHPLKIAPSKLRTFHKNPRRGDVPLVMESLKANGQYRPLIVNVGSYTGRPNEVLAGNHLLAAAMKLQLEAVDVHWVDVDNERAKRIVLVDNRAADRGKYDQDALSDLLDSAEDLVGTGYTDDDLAELLDGPPQKEVTFKVKEKTLVVTVDASSEREQDEIVKALTQLGYAARAGK